ncbi:MAG: hypothetical protein IPO92_13810 [Saprospiraceae bacterium]|nr:hypothetical protein [Saprospiraceae bacterium]
MEPNRISISINPTTGEIVSSISGGFQSIQPQAFQDLPKQISPLRLSTVSCYNIKAKEMKTLLPENWENKPMSLSYNENNIDLTFSVLDYRNPTTEVYQYSLVAEGKAPYWIDLGEKNKVSFAQMAPGSYIFSAKGAIVMDYGVSSIDLCIL